MHRRAAELRAADDQRVLEQAARLQILDHRRERLVGVLRVLAVRLDVGVRVPRIALGVVDLHHAHALLDQPHRHQAAARRAARAVQLERRLALLADVEDLRRFGLHPVGGLHRLDRRLELRVVDRSRSSCSRLSCLEQIELAPLLGQRELVVVDVGDQLLRIEVLADDLGLGLLLDLVGDEGALMHGRQEGAVPQRRADRRRHVGTEDDEAGQVLVVGAEAVGQPRAERRPARPGVWPVFIISIDGS